MKEYSMAFSPSVLLGEQQQPQQGTPAAGPSTSTPAGMNGQPQSQHASPLVGNTASPASGSNAAAAAAARAAALAAASRGASMSPGKQAQSPAGDLNSGLSSLADLFQEFTNNNNAAQGLDAGVGSPSTVPFSPQAIAAALSSLRDDSNFSASNSPAPLMAAFSNLSGAANTSADTPSAASSTGSTNGSVSAAAAAAHMASALSLQSNGSNDASAPVASVSSGTQRLSFNSNDNSNEDASAQLARAIMSIDDGARTQLLSALLSLPQRQSSSNDAGQMLQGLLGQPQRKPQQAGGDMQAPTSMGYDSQHPSPTIGRPVQMPESGIAPLALQSPATSPYIHPQGGALYGYQTAPVQQQQFSHPAQSSLPAQGFVDNSFQPYQQQQQPAQRPTATPQDAMGPMRNFNHTGASFATSAVGTEEWGDNDYTFSPLLSPALTPASSFSLAPSSTGLPAHIPPTTLPADYFAQLGSPALTGQLQYGLSASDVSGLIEQARSMGLDPATLQHQQQQQLAALYAQLPPNAQLPAAAEQPHHTRSPSGGQVKSGVRRGASTKKARPSPLMKPTDPPASASRSRKKAATAASSVRRSGSIGSTGARSTTASPFIEPLNKRSSLPAAAATALSNSTGGAHPAGNSSSSNNDEPSPIDIDMSLGAAAESSAAAAQREMMPPPPRPSTSPTRFTPSSLLHMREESREGTRLLASSSSAAIDDNAPEQIPMEIQDEPQSRSQSASASQSANPSPILAPTTKKEPARKRAASTSKRGAKAGSGGTTPRLKPLIPSGASSDVSDRLAAKSNYQNIVEGRGDVLGLDNKAVTALQAERNPAGETRRMSHKVAEQRRRDSLKKCFEDLRHLLPPLAHRVAMDEDRIPGENMIGSRMSEPDPDHPNKGVSKVALLRRSNEFLGTLRGRIDRRDDAIAQLRHELAQARALAGMDSREGSIDGLNLDDLDEGEEEAGPLEKYENLDSDDEDNMDGMIAAAAASTSKGGARPRTRRRESALSVLSEESKPVATDQTLYQHQ